MTDLPLTSIVDEPKGGKSWPKPYKFQVVASSDKHMFDSIRLTEHVEVGRSWNAHKPEHERFFSVMLIITQMIEVPSHHALTNISASWAKKHERGVEHAILGIIAVNLEWSWSRDMESNLLNNIEDASWFNKRDGKIYDVFVLFERGLLGK